MSKTNKVYGSKDVADAIAAKLSKKGVEHLVKPVDGGFQVYAAGAHTGTEVSIEAGAQMETPVEQAVEIAVTPELPAMSGTATAAAQTGTPVKKKTSAGSSGAKLKDGEVLVVLEVEGAKVTPEFVITPPIGKRPRWFEKKRLHLVTPVPGGVVMVLKKKDVASRGIDVSELVPYTDDAAAEAAA